MKKTYDAYINGIFKTGLTRIQLESYTASGYTVQVVQCYSASDNDYNSIAIRTEDF